MLVERHQSIHLGGVPEAVVNHFGDFRGQAIAQVQQVAIERQLFDVAVGFIEQRHARCFVDAAAFHADEAVFDHVDAGQLRFDRRFC